MKTILCGYPKSGNSLLYKILRELAGDDFASYTWTFGLSDIIMKLCHGYMTFPNIAVYDNIRFSRERDGAGSGRVQLEFPHPRCRRVEVSGTAIEALKESSILWSHERPDRVESHLGSAFPHSRLYLVRDGRDVITSQVHYVVTCLSRRLRPEYEYETADEVYDDTDLFKRWACDWAAHVRAYRANRQKYVSVKFEDLVNRKRSEIIRLGAALGVHPIDDEELDRIESVTSYETMKTEAPEHLRRADSAGWKTEWTKYHRDIFEMCAGRELRLLGYGE